jgi:phage repressor protein C with HTH and peptisase S24 domain
MADDVRSALDALIQERGEDYSAISRLLGRNAAYIQQFIKRGTPRRLAEEDRLKLAAYFRVPEARLGGRGDGPAGGPSAPVALVTVPRIAIGASAGPGGIAEIEERGRPIAFDDGLLRDMGAGRRSALSIIRVAGESMEPTLHDGDDILVDRDAAEIRPGGIYVLRLDDLLMVKRLIRDERGLVVHSDNPVHPAIAGFDPATLQVIGRVLWCGRKL